MRLCDQCAAKAVTAREIEPWTNTHTRGSVPDYVDGQCERCQGLDLPRLDYPDAKDPALTNPIIKNHRAEQLARLHDEIYLTIAPDFRRGMELPIIPFDELPEDVRAHRIGTAAKILDEGYKTPAEAEKMKREHSRVLDLYFETGKAVGLQPEDSFEDGPQRARNLAAMVTRWETLAVDRQLAILELSKQVAEATGDPVAHENIPEVGADVKPRPGWHDLLDFAAAELYDAQKGYMQVYELEKSSKAADAAQALLEIKVMLDNPMKTMRLIVKDRDLWQMKCEALEYKLALTEAGLGESQAAVVDLAKGHDKMIALLERLARFMNWIQGAGERPMHEGTEDNIGRLGADVAALLNSGDVKAVEV